MTAITSPLQEQQIIMQNQLLEISSENKELRKRANKEEG